MMQPPFQIRPISARLMFQLYSSEPARMSAMPCAYAQIRAA